MAGIYLQKINENGMESYLHLKKVMEYIPEKTIIRELEDFFDIERHVKK